MQRFSMVKRIFESCYCVDYINQVDKITFLSARLWLLSMTREFSRGQVVFAVTSTALLCRCHGHHDVDKQGFMFPDVTPYPLQFVIHMGSSGTCPILTKFRGILLPPFLGPSGLRRFYTAQHSKRLQSSCRGILNFMA